MVQANVVVNFLNLIRGCNMKNYVLQFNMQTVDGIEIPVLPIENKVQVLAGNLFIVENDIVNSPNGRYKPVLFMMYKAYESNTFVVFGENNDLNDLVKLLRDTDPDTPKISLKQYAKTVDGKKWKCRRVKGTDKDNNPEANPEDRIDIENKIIFLDQDAPDTDPTKLNPLTINDMEITDMRPSIPCTIAGYDLPNIIDIDE